MRVDLFNFDLPRERIAGHPVSPRDAARLLVVGDTLEDRIVRDLPDLFRPGDVMVLNDTQVIPARLRGTRGGARVEVTLHREVGDGRWLAFARPAKRLKPGQHIAFDGGGLSAEVLSREGGEVELAFSESGEAFWTALGAAGEMPLPPYIERGDGAEVSDKANYQTIFAREPGAVAAPTAGLHFTPELFAALDARGIKRVFTTLHVGAGTFLPVKVDDTDEHRMHSEYGRLDAATVAEIEASRAAGGRVVAVGSTSLRVLEAAADEAGQLVPFAGEIDLFITPGYRFKVVERLMTNFHLPCSTLFMMVAAFAGLDRMKDAYAHAIREEYRFYSYGDACLLSRASGEGA